MDRHHGWCVIVALVGGGQEINTGEIGIAGWRDAIAAKYPNWDVYYSDKLNQAEYAGGAFDPATLTNQVCVPAPELHLATSMRSYRAEALSTMIHHLIAGDSEAAARTFQTFSMRLSAVITKPSDCWSVNTQM